MHHIGLEELKQLAITTKPLPTLPIISKFKNVLKCVVCFKIAIDGSVVHTDCLNTICARCCLRTIEENCHPSCVVCRRSLLTVDGTALAPLPPANTWMQRNITFNCGDCWTDLFYEEAIVHPNQCEHSISFKPPSKIHDWHEIKSVNCPMLSNPPDDTVGKVPQEALIVANSNGGQVFSKFFKRSKFIGDLTQILSEKTGVSSDKLVAYKFSHKKLTNDVRIGDIARSNGPTHLTFFNGNNTLASRYAILSYNDTGPLPTPTLTQQSNNT